VDREELKLLKDIEKLIKREIPKVVVEGFVPSDKPEPEAPRSTQAHGRPPRGHARNAQGASTSNGSNQNAGRNANTNNNPSQGRGLSQGRNPANPNAEGRPARSHNQNAPRPANAANAQQPRNAQTRSESPNTKNMSEAARHQAMPQPALFAPPASPRRHQPSGQNAGRPNANFGNPSRSGGRGR
jgi:ATP-dependent RNA helicase RhlE